MTTIKHVFEQDGLKFNLSALLLFPYVKPASGALQAIPYLELKIELYDGLDPVSSKTVIASPLNYRYNCVRVDIPYHKPVTHMYYSLLDSRGVKELRTVVAVGTHGAQT